MLVDLFGKLADFFAQCGGQAGVFGGEGVSVEAGGFAVNRVISNTQASAQSQCPSDMNIAGQYAQVKCVIQCDSDELVIGQDASFKKLENTMFGDWPVAM